MIVYAAIFTLTIYLLHILAVYLLLLMMLKVPKNKMHVAMMVFMPNTSIAADGYNHSSYVYVYYCVHGFQTDFMLTVRDTCNCYQSEMW